MNSMDAAVGAIPEAQQKQLMQAIESMQVRDRYDEPLDIGIFSNIITAFSPTSSYLLQPPYV